MKRLVLRVHLLFLSLLLASSATVPLTAQVGTGTISGVVTDSSGAVLPSAAISITNTGTGVTTAIATNDQGHYVAPDLIVGVYEVKAAKQGFQTQVVKQVRLTVGSNTVVDCKLPVGQEVTTVTVTSKLPSQHNDSGYFRLDRPRADGKPPAQRTQFRAVDPFGPWSPGGDYRNPELVLRKVAKLFGRRLTPGGSGTASGWSNHFRASGTTARETALSEHL